MVSPDESLLHVANTGAPCDVRVFDPVDRERLANNLLFAVVRPGVADGFRVDTDGNLFTSAWDGIQVYGPNGELRRSANANWRGVFGVAAGP